jgi:DNA-binding CsgD family transcriptional regulator
LFGHDPRAFARLHRFRKREVARSDVDGRIGGFVKHCSKASRGTLSMSELVESIARIAQAPDVLALRRETLAFIRARGFGGAYFLSPIARDSREGRVLNNMGFDELWARAYRWYLHRVDPLPEVALSRSAPFRWSDAPKLRELSEPERRYMAILARRGMADGLAIPTFGPGSRVGMAGLGLHPDLGSVGPDRVLKLQLAVQASYQRYCDLIAPEAGTEAVLSQREMDVLYWISRGKSNAAIAIILEIAPGTVDTYVRRIFRKFAVTDRVGAVVAAVQHGYVIAGDYRRIARD